MCDFSRGIYGNLTYTLIYFIGISFFCIRCTETLTELEENMYTYLTGCDSIYLFGSESSLIKSLDSMATKRLNSKEENAIANIAAYLNYYSSSPKITKQYFSKFSDYEPDSNQYSLLSFDYLLYNIPESIHIERFKQCVDTCSYWYKIYKYNRIAQYYIDVDLELDSARHYFLQSYDLLKTHPKITREHFRTYNGMALMAPILRKHHEGIYFSNLLCDFENYVFPPDSLMRARAFLLRANMLFREGDYDGSYEDNAIALQLIDSTTHTYEYQKYLENELVFTNRTPEDIKLIDDLLVRLTKNVQATGFDIANVHRLKGRSLLDRGQYQKAIPELVTAYEQAMDYHFFSVKHLSYICDCLVSCHKALGSYEKAIHYLEIDDIYSGGRMKLNKKNNDFSFFNKLSKAEVYYSKFNASHNINDLYRVAALLQKVDSVMWNEYKVTDEQAIIQFYWESGNVFFSLGVETFYNLYNKTKDQAYLIQYLKFADMRKSSLLYRDQVLSVRSKETKKSIYEKQLLLTAQMKEAYLKGARGNPDFNQIVEQYLAHERSAETEIPAIKDDFKITSSREINLHNIKASLGGDETLLDIVQHGSDIYYTIISNKNVEVIKNQIDENNMDKLQKYLMLDNMLNATYVTSLKQSLIPEEVKRKLRSKVIIIPDGFFHRLPMAYLLGSAYEVTYLPSFKFIKPISSTSPKKIPTKWAVFAFSDKNTIMQNADTGLPELPGTYSEAVQILKNQPSAIIYTGKEATKENFIKAYTDPAITSIHLATHGYAVSHRKEDIKLYFRTRSGGIDSLYGYDLLRHRSTVQQIKLSACDSGKGKVVEGEGNYTLARYFIINGAQEVVSSLQKMKDFNADEDVVVRYRL